MVAVDKHSKSAMVILLKFTSIFSTVLEILRIKNKSLHVFVNLPAYI